MGQQPNIEHDLAELPRVGAERAPERRWSPGRPGEISSPADVPRSAAFGRPGPDTGWALKLLRAAAYDRDAAGARGEAVLAAIVGARAAHFGRGPVPEDVEVALSLLGLRPDGVDEPAREVLARRRSQWVRAAAHERTPGMAALRAIPQDLLADTPVHVRARLNADPELVG